MNSNEFAQRIVTQALNGHVVSGTLGYIQLNYGRSKMSLSVYHDGIQWGFENVAYVSEASAIVSEWDKIAAPFAGNCTLYIKDGNAIKWDGRTRLHFTGIFCGFTEFE